MQAINGIKIFQIDGWNWWAGASLEECVADYIKETGNDDPVSDARELTDEEADMLIYVEDFERRLDIAQHTKTFRQKLQELVRIGKVFPCFFDSTEF